MTRKTTVKKVYCRDARKIGDMNLLGVKQGSLSVKSRSQNPPGQHGASKKKGTDYSVMLNEKQKLRIIHGYIKEKQFRKFYEIATRKKGQTALNLLQTLEIRLVNVVFKAGFASTLAEARQLVAHKAIALTRPGKKTVVASSGSTLVMPGTTISIVEKARQQTRVQSAMSAHKENDRTLSWLNLNYEDFSAEVSHLPDRDQLPQNVNENLIIELYSK